VCVGVGGGLGLGLGARLPFSSIPFVVNTTLTRLLPKVTAYQITAHSCDSITNSVVFCDFSALCVCVCKQLNDAHTHTHIHMHTQARTHRHTHAHTHYMAWHFRWPTLRLPFWLIFYLGWVMELTCTLAQGLGIPLTPMLSRTEAIKCACTHYFKVCGCEANLILAYALCVWLQINSRPR
jgi:hypothetical protein